MKIVADTTAKLAPSQEVTADYDFSAPSPPEVEPATHELIDSLESRLLTRPDILIDLPIMHTFTPGLYTRTIYMPAGSVVTSKIHKTEHPFFVVKGRVSVLVPGHDPVEIEAPHMGITQAGTRRVLLVHEDTVWITTHANPTDTEDLEEIESRLIERRLLTEGTTAYDFYTAALAEDVVLLGTYEQYDYMGAP